MQLFKLAVICLLFASACKPNIQKTPKVSRKPSSKSLSLAEFSLKGEAPPNSIAKGVFQFWTVPSSPTTGQDYVIHILVNHGVTSESYTKEDLSGEVIGTDGYFQGVNGSSGTVDFRGEYGIFEQGFQNYDSLGKAAFAMNIPGRAAGVSDALRIHSKVKGEEQVF